MTEDERAILAMIARYPHKLGHLVGMKDLTELHSDWIRHCWNNPSHSFLQAHRGGFKTSAITIVGPVYWLIFNPEESIAVCRKTHTEGCDTLGAILKLYENPDIRALYAMAHGKEPDFTTKRGNRVTFDFRTTADKAGSIDVYGVESSLTGTHYGKMILDDIVTLKDRLSRAEREHTKEFLREVVVNIINPGKQVMHVGTPWHKDDAWSMFDGKGGKKFPIARYPVSDTGLRSPEWVEEQRKMTTPSLWAANYDLVHQSDDRTLFKDPTYGPWEHSPLKAVAHVDAAFGGDHFSGFTIMRKRPSGKIQTIMKSWGGHIKHHYRDIVGYCRDYRANVLYIETNADKGFVAEAIREMARSMGCELLVKEYSERQNKGIKIATNLSYHWENLIFDEAETDEEAMNQTLDWMEGQEPDDSPDSASSLLREVFGGPLGNDPLFMYR